MAGSGLLKTWGHGLGWVSQRLDTELGGPAVSTELRRLRNYIDGEFKDAADGRTTEVVNPATGEAYATAPLSGPADVDAAMTAAAAAFPAWRDATPAERQRALLK